MATQGVLYHGLEVMGGGSILTGLVLAAIGVFVIEREFIKASAFALAGAVLTYFGFMHGDAVGIGARLRRDAVGGARLSHRRRLPVRAGARAGHRRRPGQEAAVPAE